MGSTPRDTARSGRKVKGMKRARVARPSPSATRRYEERAGESLRSGERSSESGEEAREEEES